MSDSYCNMLYDSITVTRTLVTIVGMIGSILSIILVKKTTMSGGTVFMISALAVTDFILLFCQFLDAVWLRRSYDMSLGPPGILLNCSIRAIFIAKIIDPIFMMSYFFEVWLIVLITINRFISTVIPTRASMLCSLKSVKIQVIILSIVTLGLNNPEFYLEVVMGIKTIVCPLNENRVDMFKSEGLTDIMNNELGTTIAFPSYTGDTGNWNTHSSESKSSGEHLSYIKHPGKAMGGNQNDARSSGRGFKPKPSFTFVLYKEIIHGVIIFAMPLFLLLSLNLSLIVALYRIKKRRKLLIGPITSKQNKKSSASEESVTVMLVTVALVFLILNLPRQSQEIAFLVFGIINGSCSWFRHMAHLCIVINFAINFILYFACSRQFRRAFKLMFCKRVAQFRAGDSMTNSSASANVNTRSMALRDITSNNYIDGGT